MTSLDYVVLVLYFAATTLIGILLMLKVNKQVDFFLGSRTFRRLFQAFKAGRPALPGHMALSLR